VFSVSMCADLAEYLCVCLCVFLSVFVDAPALKCFKLVERKSQFELLRVVFDDPSLTAAVLSGSVSKLHLTVS